MPLPTSKLKAAEAKKIEAERLQGLTHSRLSKKKQFKAFCKRCCERKRTNIVPIVSKNNLGGLPGISVYSYAFVAPVFIAIWAFTFPGFNLNMKRKYIIEKSTN